MANETLGSLKNLPTNMKHTPRQIVSLNNPQLFFALFIMEGFKNNESYYPKVTEEMKPGGFVPLNGLVKIELRPLNPPELPVTLFSPVIFDVPAGGSKIKVWESATKGTLVTLPKIYATPTELPKELWVEGVETSSTARDITLALQCGGFDDRIRVTVFKLDIEIYTNGSWHNVTDDNITVLNGTKYQFRAILDPVLDTWPSDKFSWSGAATGSEQTVEVTFDSTGSRTLTATFYSCSKNVTINVVAPEPDQVSFIDNSPDEEHDIYGVTDPVWKRENNPNNPACYTKNKFIKVQSKFWASENLTYSTDVYVDVEDQTTSWPFISDTVTFKNWPSEASEHRSTNKLDDNIGIHSYTLKWKYKVPSGTNEQIEMPNTTGVHKIYAVYGAPKCSSSDYTKHHLDLVCNWANGGVLVTENDVPKKVQENCFRNFDWVHLSNPWDLETTGGDCETHAELMAKALKVLGIEAVDDKVGEYRYCWSHLGYEWHCIVTTSGSGTNFEGVCEVELIDESWTCYYDKAMGAIGGTPAYQKGNHENMWTEWNSYPPPDHKVIYVYTYWENHEDE